MLRRLTVRNLAIVEDIALELGPGLTVITGETGAGKSILVDALALLAGGRGSADLVRRGADRLVVSGEFGSAGALPKCTPLWVLFRVGANHGGRLFRVAPPLIRDANTRL